MCEVQANWLRGLIVSCRQRKLPTWSAISKGCESVATTAASRKHGHQMVSRRVFRTTHYSRHKVPPLGTPLVDRDTLAPFDMALQVGSFLCGSSRSSHATNFAWTSHMHFSANFLIARPQCPHRGCCYSQDLSNFAYRSPRLLAGGTPFRIPSAFESRLRDAGTSLSQALVALALHRPPENHFAFEQFTESPGGSSLAIPGLIMGNTKQPAADVSCVPSEAKCRCKLRNTSCTTSCASSLESRDIRGTAREACVIRIQSRNLRGAGGQPQQRQRQRYESLLT